MHLQSPDGVQRPKVLIIITPMMPLILRSLFAVAMVQLLSVSAFSQSGTVYHLSASDFPVNNTGFYREGDRLAIDPSSGTEASTKTLVPAGNSSFRVVLHTMGEDDGSSEFEVLIDGHVIGTHKTPLSSKSAEEGEKYWGVWNNVEIDEGRYIEVRAKTGSVDGQGRSRARWTGVSFYPLGGDPGKSTAIKSDSGSGFDGLVEPRSPDGDGTVTVSGELKTWHKVTVSLAGPYAHEKDAHPNPFLDYSMYVHFTHASGAPTFSVPGYFAADGNAGETSSESGTAWKAHFSPNKTGEWKYWVSFVTGPRAAVSPQEGKALAPFDGRTGSIQISETDKSGVDFRSKGRLSYTGGRYLQFEGTKGYFLKAGPDAPETFLAYEDFDNTITMKPKVPIKTWAPHARDFKKGDPTWKEGKGKNIVGALNYLSGKGVNALSFLTYNAGGDGDNIWPFVERDAKFHYDCSKLDQWAVVLEHAQRVGVFLHFKLQENELDDNRKGARKDPVVIKESLDGGLLGPERKLYLREIIARFGHNLALNWNLGEENTQSYQEVNDMAEYIRSMDTYDHLVVIHTFPQHQELVYPTVLGHQTVITGSSLQNHWSSAHRQTLRWLDASARAGKIWVVANDEQNPAQLGVPPDPGYKGFDGKAMDKGNAYDLHDIRKYTLWGNLMAGGAGVEYYFGYKLLENDLVAEDYRSRDRTWDYCRIALEFFQTKGIPFWRMWNANELVGNDDRDNSAYCLAERGEVYVIYLPKGGEQSIDLTEDKGSYSIFWYNPREGGRLQKGQQKKVKAGGKVTLGSPPADPGEDWVVLLKR